MFDKRNSLGDKKNYACASETLSQLKLSFLSVTSKPSIEKTGTHFGCFKRDEFNKISEE